MLMTKNIAGREGVLNLISHFFWSKKLLPLIFSTRKSVIFIRSLERVTAEEVGDFILFHKTSHFPFERI